MIAADLQVGVLSKIGGRERNEDACGYWAGEQSSFACYVLADGAGGHGGGDVAARIAVQSVLDHYSSDPQASCENILALLKHANRSVIAGQISDQRLTDMRSTIVVLQIDALRQYAFWGHVGDSRLYCFQDGRVLRRTKDHSLLQELLDAGLTRLSTGSSSNVLTGSLGGDECFTPSAVDQPVPIASGDAFLICSDGFWGGLTEQAMETSLRQASSPDSWLRHLEQTFAQNIGPGSDNYSAIAVWFEPKHRC